MNKNLFVQDKIKLLLCSERISLRNTFDILNVLTDICIMYLYHMNVSDVLDFHTAVSLIPNMDNYLKIVKGARYFRNGNSQYFCPSRFSREIYRFLFSSNQKTWAHCRGDQIFSWLSRFAFSSKRKSRHLFCTDLHL